MAKYFEAASLIGTRVGQWHLLELLGTGGMSYVFKGRHRSTEELGAVKLLRPEFCKDRKAVQRFEQEARLISQLNHPNIIRVLDFDRDEEQGWFFLVMEYLLGVDLSSLMEGKPLPKSWISGLLEQLCKALQMTHEHGMIHRDLKPSNIFLLPPSSGLLPQVKLLDFGVAKLLYQKTEHQLTGAGEIIGTPSYVAPEQFMPSRGVKAGVDIYAIGVLLFEFFTGELPLDGGSAIAHAVLVLKEVPPKLGERREEFAGSKMEALIHRVLSKEPDDRPGSMLELWAEYLDAAKELDDPLDKPENYPAIEVRDEPFEEEASDTKALDAFEAGQSSHTTSMEAKPSRVLTIDAEQEEEEVGEATFVMEEGMIPAMPQPPPEMDAAEAGEETFMMESSIERPSDGEEQGEVTMLDEPLPVVVGELKPPVPVAEESLPVGTLVDGQTKVPKGLMASEPRRLERISRPVLGTVKEPGVPVKVATATSRTPRVSPRSSSPEIPNTLLPRDLSVETPRQDESKKTTAMWAGVFGLALLLVVGLVVLVLQLIKS